MGPFRRSLGELNARLEACRAARERKLQLERLLEGAASDRDRLQVAIDAHRATTERQLRDVFELEEGGVVAFFYGLLGSLEERLVAERQEHVAARLKLRAAEAELAALGDRQRFMSNELARLTDADAALADALDAKQAILAELGGAVGKELLELAEEAGCLLVLEGELGEAIQEAEQARTCLERLAENLYQAQRAEGFGAFLAGPMVAMPARAEHIERAVENMEASQHHLAQFRRECADLAFDLQSVIIDGGATFADRWIDNLVLDWVVHHRVDQTLAQARAALEQVESAIALLVTRQIQVVRDLGKLRHRRLDILQAV